MSGASDWMNDLAFRARGRLRWSAPAWSWPARSFDPVIARLPADARARAADLRARYDLAAWPPMLSRSQLHENLYVLDVLDACGVPAQNSRRGLDVGAKDGATLAARVAAAPIPWDLIELDAHRRYFDLSTRRAHGERFAAAFPGCRYLAGSVLELGAPYDLVTWFLPFVRLRPLRAWGLPPRFFQPKRLLSHVISLVAPGGQLLVVNQGEAERDIQATLFAEAGLSVQTTPLTSALSPFRLPRFLFLWKRPPSRS